MHSKLSVFFELIDEKKLLKLILKHESDLPFLLLQKL